MLSFIDEKVGLDNTIIAFSADHGGPEVPADLNQYGFEANYVQPEKWEKGAGFDALKKRFGIGEDLVREYAHPYLYLNRELIAEKGLDLGEVEDAVAAAIFMLSSSLTGSSMTWMALSSLRRTDLLGVMIPLSL